MANMYREVETEPIPVVDAADSTEKKQDREDKTQPEDE